MGSKFLRAWDLTSKIWNLSDLDPYNSRSNLINWSLRFSISSAYIISIIERIQENHIKVCPYKACAEALIPSLCYASVLTFTYNLIMFLT